ncbi:unnamed protein product [Urochloa humidicola]
MDISRVLASPSYAKAADAYKKAVATAATVTAYTVLVRGVARELVPYELRSAARWAVSAVRNRLVPPPKPRRIKTIYIFRYGHSEDDEKNRFFWDARAHLATRVDPAAMRRLCLTNSSGGRQKLSVLPGDTITDVFEGVEFTWTPMTTSRSSGPPEPDMLVLTFDAEHTEVALGRYVPSITAAMEEARRQETALQIFINDNYSWEGITHQHPATFDTVAMDPALKQTIIADLDRFLKRNEYYRRIGKAWKRGYLLYGPPGTGKSSLIAAMANYLRFDLYDLDISRVGGNRSLQKLLTAMPNKSILVIEDIDCCFTANSRDGKKHDDESEDCSDEPPPPPPPRTSYNYKYNNERERITLSGLLNFVDGLWSTSGEERIIIFTTNYKERLDAALLRPGRMDMHIYMGYCCWEAFKTLAKNYFLVEDHELFPDIQKLLSAVDVTPAEATEMLLRSEDADVALEGFVEFLQDKKKPGRSRSKK